MEMPQKAKKPVVSADKPTPDGAELLLNQPMIPEPPILPGSLGNPYLQTSAYIPVQPYYKPDGSVWYPDYWIDVSGMVHPINSSSFGCDCYSCQKNKMMLDPSITQRKLRERAYEIVQKRIGRNSSNSFDYPSPRHHERGFDPDEVMLMLADFGMSAVIEAQQEVQAKVKYQSMMHANEVADLKRQLAQQTLAKKPQAVSGTHGRLFRDGDEPTV